ncbi:MAG: selenium cofactor biosynthesis protein YqeC [Spirochaetales bacterium]|nr:selenium cofactor biosynthesis protein YqeC [Spirochaetales bacterium]
MTSPFSQALGLKNGDVLTLSGGGGKTSLLMTLARENALKNGLYTCSTKMFDPRSGSHPFDRILVNWQSERLPDACAGACFAAGAVLPSRVKGVPDKVKGLSNKTLESWNSADGWSILVIEADGAAGKPLKYPGPHEPVIPGNATHAVGCIGMEVLGKSPEPELVHRCELFKERLIPGGKGIVKVETLAALINDPEGLFKNCPEKNGFTRTVVLNKMELLDSRFSIKDVIRSLRKDCPSVRVMGTSLKTGQIID